MPQNPSGPINEPPGTFWVAAYKVGKAPWATSLRRKLYLSTLPVSPPWWLVSGVGAMPGWTAMARSRLPAALSRRCSSTANSTSASFGVAVCAQLAIAAFVPVQVIDAQLSEVVRDRRHDDHSISDMRQQQIRQRERSEIVGR